MLNFILFCIRKSSKKKNTTTVIIHIVMNIIVSRPNINIFVQYVQISVYKNTQYLT